jgi:hypothetical protein
MRCGLSCVLLVCAVAGAVAADPPTFVGTWSTTYGTMTLTDDRGTLSGTYGGKNGITGTVKDGRFTFKYIEPGVIGEGYFELSPDGQSFAGKWRPNGRQEWSSWTGKRPQAPVAKPAVPPGDGPVGEPPDEAKPVVYKFGSLPPGLPAYFTQGDTDRDGQVGLYEWVQSFGNEEAALGEFKKLDLNGDGLLTAEEYLRAKKAGLVADPVKAGPPSPGGSPSRGQSGDEPKKGDREQVMKRAMDVKK